jgi:modulator of FtsH protease HflC
MKILATLAIVLIGAVIFFYSSAYIVTEGRQAVITEFGKPVGKPITKAGLHFKKPFVQVARFVDKRILSWDGYPNQIPTKDKKYISVDTTARWRIVDALKFIQSVQNERLAKARLDSILDANTRDVISRHNLVEAVRNSNQILDHIKNLKDEQKKRKASQENFVEEEVDVDIEKVAVGREKLSQLIVEKSTKELTEFGIEIIDVQLRRISYEKSVEQKVYERMISERQRIAEKIRSIGKGEQAKIQGRLSRDLQRIESEAYRTSQVIKGKAEAKSIKVYAKAMGRDPKFYDFLRSMEAYKKSLTGETEFILSNNSEFLKYLKTFK